MPLVIKISIWFSLIFMLSELALTLFKRSSARSSRKRQDRGSAILIWVVITICLTAGFNLARFNGWQKINYIFGFSGLFLIVTGLLVRWGAIIQLKKAFTVDVAISENQKLKTDGLYTMIRHPSYSGLLLFIAGESMVMNTIRSFIIAFIPVALAILYRIFVEEKLLVECFGDEYRQYREHTWYLIPHIY